MSERGHVQLSVALGRATEDRNAPGAATLPKGGDCSARRSTTTQQRHGTAEPRCWVPQQEQQSELGVPGRMQPQQEGTSFAAVGENHCTSVAIASLQSPVKLP